MAEGWIWDLYWQCDRIASCFDGAGAANYGEQVADGWRAFFADLPENARILDLCTGNGAIPLIAAAVSQAQGKDFSITAVDQAAIDPATYVTRHRDELAAIDFIGSTAIEALPFPDGSFDAAVSQFGVEYADVPRAVAEVARVLGPDARVRFVVHASEGIVASKARVVIADADILLNDIDLVGTARRCFDAVGQVERGDASLEARHRAEQCVAAFKTALKRTDDHIPLAADQLMFNNSGGVLLDAYRARREVGHEVAAAKIDVIEREILAHRGRLQALIDAALDEPGAESLLGRLKAAGATSGATAKLECDEGLIGHVVTARF